jgi:hypothetical protein
MHWCNQDSIHQPSAEGAPRIDFCADLPGQVFMDNNNLGPLIEEAGLGAVILLENVNFTRGKAKLSPP